MYRERIGPVLDFLDNHGIFPSSIAHPLTVELFNLAETHPLTLALFQKMMAYQGKRFVDERLKTNLGKIELDNPLIVGAGWTKTSIKSNQSWC